jgi:predicted nuclease with TOPRIM domain
MRRAPINNTCPTIDRYITNIKSCIESNNNLERYSADDLQEVAINMNSQLIECIEYLEELRDSNRTLRDWGEEMAAEADELKKELSSIERELT